MNKNFSVSIILLLLLTSFTPFFTSCVSDDLDNCPPAWNVRILVKPDTETSRAAADRYQIDQMTLYVFDQSDKFVTSWQGGAYTFGTPYEAYLSLTPGNYRFIIWTNQGEIYQTNYTLNECQEQKPWLNDLQFYMNCPQAGIITGDIPDLHHGDLKEAKVQENTQNEFTIILKPNTYKINFTVKGLPVNENEYHFRIRDNNSHYKFNNAIVAEQPEFSFLKTTQFEESNELYSTIKTLRLTSIRKPMFDFTCLTSGECLHEDNLVEMIAKAYATGGQNVNFSTTFEFDIVLAFNASVGVTVTVNGWSYTENKTNL